MKVKIIYIGLAIVCLFIANNCAKETKTDDKSGVVCTKEAKLCPDGSSVGRDPYNNCEFKPCPVEINCIDDVKICSDGFPVVRDPNNNCEFKPCAVED